MNKRAFLGASVALSVLPWIARSQQRQIYRIGYLHPTDPGDFAAIAFRQALKDFGFVAGQNMVIEERFAEGHNGRLRALAADLVARRVDIIVAVSPPAISAARAATQTIPIVMAFSGNDPVKSGFAVTLARPGGNTTGVTWVAYDASPKLLEVLSDLVPGLKAVAVFGLAERPGHAAQIDVLRTAADTRGIRIHVVAVRSANEYAEAFATIASAGDQAVVVLSAPELTRDRFRLVELAAKHRIPSIHEFAVFTSIGGLVSYGPDVADLSSRAVEYVDKILKGANPAEMPIEQSRKFLLAINRRTANALGLTISPALLLQADQIIQ